MRPRPRLLLALSFTLASALGAYACDNGTFPNALNVYDNDSGPPFLDDSSVPDVTTADVQVTPSDGGDAAASKDGGDAGQVGDAGEGGSETDGDAASDLDAADGNG